MKRLLPTFVVLLMCAAARGQLPVPRLTSVFPPGAKRGATIEVGLSGGELDETTKLYFSHAGINAEKIPEPADKKLRFKVAVSADCPAGHYDVRSIGKFGISNPRTFVVGEVDELLEQEPNNTQPQANRVQLNGITNGQVNPGEDVDWFVFSAKAGQRVLVECNAWRIDSKLDGFMWLYDAQGRQLAASQDENIRDEKNDPLIDFLVPTDGDYYLKLTDFMYAGDGDHFYRLSFSTLPLIDLLLPSGAKPGETASITLLGRNLPGGERTDLLINGRPLDKLVRSIAIPADAQTVGGLRLDDVLRPPASSLNGMSVRLSEPAGGSNSKLLLLSDLPEIAEQEPNNEPEKAQRLTLPVAVTGMFNPSKDVDYYTFVAPKRQPISVEVFAQRIGSPADPDMEVLDAKGKVMANSQDDGENIGQLRFTTNSRDLRYDLNASEAGEVTLRVEHLYGQQQGGPQFLYRLEVKPKTEDFQLICQPMHENRIFSPVVYQGGRERLDILVWRLHGHNAPITVTARGLPAGVSAEPIVLGPGIKWGTLVVTAAADAPPGESEIEIFGVTEKEGVKVERKARGGTVVWDTNNTPAISRIARSIVLAVREPAPFTVTAAPGQLTVKQGEPIGLSMQVRRRAEVPGDVQLSGAGYQLPQGMAIPLTKFAAGQEKAELKIDSDKIPPGTYSFIVNGEAQVPSERAGKKQNIRCVYPSNPVTLKVLPKN